VRWREGHWLCFACSLPACMGDMRRRRRSVGCQLPGLPRHRPLPSLRCPHCSPSPPSNPNPGRLRSHRPLSAVESRDECVLTTPTIVCQMQCAAACVWPRASCITMHLGNAEVWVGGGAVNASGKPRLRTHAGQHRPGCIVGAQTSGVTEDCRPGAAGAVGPGSHAAAPAATARRR
jgi:hypothetical protein